MAWFYNHVLGLFSEIGLVASPKTALNPHDRRTKQRSFDSIFLDWTALWLSRAFQSERHSCTEFAHFLGLF